MTLINLYLLNNDWQHDTEIMVYYVNACKKMRMQKAIHLYGKKRVLWFSREEVVLYEN